jgi:hypothetical protein
MGLFKKDKNKAAEKATKAAIKKANKEAKEKEKKEKAAAKAKAKADAKAGNKVTTIAAPRTVDTKSSRKGTGKVSTLALIEELRERLHRRRPRDERKPINKVIDAFIVEKKLR